ncbi:histidine kinase dimerization/phospho-acceptor domain-containing protein [Oscillospiraceae bacterium 44-5]
MAKFSRWYLGDYPVYVQEHPQGLLVVGGETGSLPEKGDLAAINRQLNKAGAFIAKKDSARADWISGVSHDVRTPLSVILGFAGQLEDDRTLPAPARERASHIRRQREQLRSLISDLNLTSRLEYAMQPLRAETRAV